MMIMLRWPTGLSDFAVDLQGNALTLGKRALVCEVFDQEKRTARQGHNSPQTILLVSK